MLTLKGKFNMATIMTDDITDDTISQIIGLLNSEVAKNSKIVIMPDCHSGKGCVIGTTLKVTDKIVPNLVGVDIGCGMLCVDVTDYLKDVSLEYFDSIVHQIPSGLKVNDDRKNWQYLKHLFKNTEEEYLQELRCFKNLENITRLVNSLGSLGGGNHFIELDKSNEGKIYLVIHTGSRNLGLQCCNYYQHLAIKDINSLTEAKKDIIERLKGEGREKNINDTIKAFVNSNEKIEDQFAYLTGDHLADYLYDMKICQEFASLNRKIIVLNILNRLTKNQKFSLHKNFDLIVNSQKRNSKINYFETIHNYINFEDMILRKGSVSAKEGELLIISMNMAYGSLICRGLGNDEWNNSAPHGAGRKMSRSKAKEVISLNEYQKEMASIYSTSINNQTIDEAPGAYKDAESIIKLINDKTVEILDVIKPIYNFKAND